MPGIKNSTLIDKGTHSKFEELSTSSIMGDLAATISSADARSPYFDKEKSTIEKPRLEGITDVHPTKNNENIELKCVLKKDRDAKHLKIRRKKQLSTFSPVEKWLGRIKSINQGECTALISNLNDPGEAKEEIVFKIEALEEEERKFAELGNTFYWFIGHTILSSKQRRRASYIRFQRTPKLTGDKITKAKERSKESVFDFDDSTVDLINNFLKKK